MVAIHYAFYGLLCFVVMTLIYLQSKFQTARNEKSKSYNFLVGTTMLFCLIDAFWGFIASGAILSKAWLKLASTLFYIGASFTAYEFLIFIINYCEYKLQYKKINNILCTIPLMVLAVVLIVNWNIGIVFYTNADGEYCRGITGYVHLVYLIHFCYYFAALYVTVYSVIKSKLIFRTLSRGTILFSIFPIITGFFQLLYPDLPFYSIGFMLSGVCIFVFQVVFDREYYSKELLRHQQKDVLDACANVIYGYSGPKKNIDLFLGLLGNYYQADRAYYCQLSEDNTQIVSSKEWLSSGTKSVIEDLKDFSIETIENWLKEFRNGNCFFRNDNSLLEEKTFEVHEYQMKTKISNILAVPLLVENKIIGFVAVDNAQDYIGDLTIIRTISFFIYSEIQRMKFMEEEAVTSGAVIQALSDEYSSIFHVDVTTDRITPYRLDKRMTSLLKRYSDKEAFYSEVYPFFVKQAVVVEDQEEMFEFGQKENLKLIIKNITQVTKRFKCAISGRTEFYEAKWSKIFDTDGNVKSIVWGLANINEKIAQKKEEDEQRLADQTRLQHAIEHAEEVSRVSQLDKLTGLYNKISGLSIMSKYLSAKEKDMSYALLFIDLDKFKDINDNFGHLEGDLILKGAGESIKLKCRAGDIAVRFGGDEFVILLKEVSTITVAQSKAQMIASEILKLSLGKEYRSTCSIGGFITTSSDLEKVLDSADKALYDVKKKGRDGIKILTESDKF